jgi:hypothetical protein
MLALRDSDEYQETARIRRAQIWEEICFWIQFRAARYIGKGHGFSLLDVGDRYAGLRERLQSFSGEYTRADTVAGVRGSADVILYLTQIQYETDPAAALVKLRGALNPGGLLYLSARVGSGFDVLTLKGATDTIYPFEHTLLPSIDGLRILLEKAGCEVLEITSPGSLDTRYVLDNIDKLAGNDLFLRYLSEKCGGNTLAEFQRFLQKSNLSSHARLVARKREVRAL